MQFTSISHHRSKNNFAVASGVISIYDLERHQAPPEVIKWPNSSDTITTVAFNQIGMESLKTLVLVSGLFIMDC